ncbi:MAG TPA: THUMP domain-containing protein [Polyangiaceae bacterium]|nr:THUMP domain-containing protein [Polyangiaceae bacterium]
MRFFATAPKGTETVLFEELSELSTPRARQRPGGVEFAGRFIDAYRVCLHSRVAGRVLWTLEEFGVRGEKDLYAAVREIGWEEHIDAARTVAVRAVGAAEGLSHTNFVAQRTKDAIVDRLRDVIGERPNVDREDPDVSVFVRLHRGRATVALDLAGQSLHKRGLRAATGPAPLKENVAAAVVRLSGWDKKSPFLDVLCGSGTLCIEADHIARDVAPGLFREQYGFQRWLSYEKRLLKDFTRLRKQARARVKSEGPEVRGSDLDPSVVAAAREYAAAAESKASFDVMDAADLKSTLPAGTVCSNTPYGERLAADPELFRRLEAALTSLAPGHRVAMLLGPETELRVPPFATRHEIYNGALECRLARWVT